MGERLYGGQRVENGFQRPRKPLARFFEESGLVLPDTEIKRLIRNNQLAVDPLEDSQFTPNGILLRLGSGLVTYPPQTIRLGIDTPRSKEVDITDSLYLLEPGEFILGSTLEKVEIPNDYFGVIDTRKEDNRAGITVHNNDGHIDPGFSGQITLEIKNNSRAAIMLYPGIPIAEFFITELSNSSNKPYSGKYLGQRGPTTYLP